jgi:hypothetical protein
MNIAHGFSYLSIFTSSDPTCTLKLDDVLADHDGLCRELAGHLNKSLKSLGMSLSSPDKSIETDKSYFKASQIST